MTIEKIISRTQSKRDTGMSNPDLNIYIYLIYIYIQNSSQFFLIEGRDRQCMGLDHHDEETSKSNKNSCQPFVSSFATA